MQVRMLRAERVSDDGRNVRWRKEGDVVDVPEALANSMIASGSASGSLADLPDSHQHKNEMKPAFKKRNG